MRPSRILSCVLVSLLVALGVTTRHGGGAATAEPVPGAMHSPRVIGKGPLATVTRRQVFQMLVDPRSGQGIAFGYLSFIEGLDMEQLYEGDGPNLESEALFTFYIDVDFARKHRNNPLHVWDVAGRISVLYDATPDGDFSDPDTFRDGTRIATGEADFVYLVDFATGTGTGDAKLTQTGAWPFELNGELLQFGETGGLSTNLFRGKTSYLRGWMRIFAAATTLQGAVSAP